MIVDAAGSLYVAGTESAGEDINDIFVLKYDADGHELWSVGKDASYDDAARAIASDGAGGAYVLGQTEGSYVLLRFDSQGNELWRVLGPGAVSYNRNTLAVDSAGRAVLSVLVYGPEPEARTIQIDGDGSILWFVAEPVGSGRPGSVAVDAASNVHVLGWTYRDTPRLLLLKYDPQGNLLWDAGGEAIDEFSSWLALSTDGRIYVACSTAEFRHVVLQYSAAGSLVWRNDAFAGGSWDDMPRSLAVDALGNAIVAGQVTTPETGNDYAIRKLDGAGKVLWDTRYNGVGHGDDSAASLVIDGQGGILVTGTSLVAGRGRELATVKYDALGRQEWVATHDPPGEIAYSSGLAADPDGNVFVAGSYFGLDSIESMLLVKYDASGRQMWTAAEGGISPGHAEAAGLAADQDGNAYLVGTNGGYVAIRYAPDGTVVWRRTYLPAGDFPYARAVAVAGIDTGGICVTGTAGSPSTDTFCATLKYDRDGNLLWEARRNSHLGPDLGAGIAIDAAESVYVAIMTSSDPGHSVARFLKYDADGNLRWESGFGVNRVAQFGVTAIAVDTLGNLYVTGPLILPSRDAITCATLKFNRAGVIEWNAFRHRAKFQNPRGLALDARGNVYVTGSARDDEEESAMETLKYNPDGTEIWAAQWIEKKGPENGASAIALDSEGSVLIAGTGSGLTGARDFVTVKYVEDDGGARFLRGDCNGDGMVRGSVTDALYLLSFSFLGGAPPPCLAACDVNADGSIAGGITDAIYLLSFTFLGGMSPPEPFPLCGSGTESDRRLGCKAPAEHCGG